MKNLFLITLCFFFLTSFAQKKGKDSGWAEKPVFSEILPENANENVVGIFLFEKYEYYHNPEGILETIHTTHKKFRINNDEYINRFNKIQVSLNDVIDLIEIKARVIKPNGKVVDFDENNIKEIQDEESGKSFKIFAIDGIEKGDDIEYSIIRKLNGQNFGRCFFQYDYPLQKASFELISPKEILYAVKSYNGFPDAKTVVLEDGRNQYSCNLENIPLIKEEKFSYITPRKARVDFRLDYNLNSGHYQRLTWYDAAQRVYETIYMDVDEKQLDKWIKSIPISGTTQLEKAMQIEKYLKDNVYIQEVHLPEFSDFGYIFENKVSSDKGIVCQPF